MYYFSSGQYSPDFFSLSSVGKFFTLLWMHIAFVLSAVQVSFPRITLQLSPKPGKANIDVGHSAVCKIVVVIASSLQLDLPSSWPAEIQIWHKSHWSRCSINHTFHCFYLILRIILIEKKIMLKHRHFAYYGGIYLYLVRRQCWDKYPASLNCQQFIYNSVIREAFQRHLK